MELISSVKMAVGSIFSNKLRTFLTMLGVIIGVGSVIVAVGFAQGSTNSITSSIEGTGTNLITIMLMGRRTSQIKYDDVAEKLEELDGIDGYTPVINSSVYLKNKDKESFSTNIIGGNENYNVIQDKTIGEGRFLTSFDVEGKMYVAVIGKYIANEIFGEGEEAVGNTIKISGQNFKVVGVLTETASAEQGSDDDIIIVPYTVMQRLMSFGNNISTIYMRSSKHDETQDIVDKTEAILYSLYQNEDYYRVTSMEAMLETLNSITETLMLVLGGIAAISLVVGGIGIMNIMIVSVTERTREIGIRKAIGARKSHIMVQFLIESLLITGLAGLMGIGIGCTIIHFIGEAGIVPAVYSTEWMLIGFLSSLAIGVIFGLFPAFKAASLNPIEALRAN